MEGISELLPEEDVRKLKSVSKRLSIPENEIVRISVEAYMQKLAGMEEELELVGFGMWNDVLEMSNSSEWVEKLRKSGIDGANNYRYGHFYRLFSRCGTG